jgi:hypothetical protein
MDDEEEEDSSEGEDGEEEERAHHVRCAIIGVYALYWITCREADM